MSQRRHFDSICRTATVAGFRGNCVGDSVLSERRRTIGWDTANLASADQRGGLRGVVRRDYGAEALIFGATLTRAPLIRWRRSSWP
jgi:hypothetical protein